MPETLPYSLPVITVQLYHMTQLSAIIIIIMRMLCMYSIRWRTWCGRRAPADLRASFSRRLKLISTLTRSLSSSCSVYEWTIPNVFTAYCCDMFITLRFCVIQDMIHIADTKVARRYGDFFIRQIHKLDEVTHCFCRSIVCRINACNISKVLYFIFAAESDTEEY